MVCRSGIPIKHIVPSCSRKEYIVRSNLQQMSGAGTPKEADRLSEREMKNLADDPEYFQARDEFFADLEDGSEEIKTP
jgi:hypothetical protein